MNSFFIQTAQFIQNIVIPKLTIALLVIGIIGLFRSIRGRAIKPSLMYFGGIVLSALTFVVSKSGLVM